MLINSEGLSSTLNNYEVVYTEAPQAIAFVKTPDHGIARYSQPVLCVFISYPPKKLKPMSKS